MPANPFLIRLATFNSTNGFRLYSIDSLDFSGHSASFTGNVSGDGFDDVLIGDYGADRSANYSGIESYSVFGFRSLEPAIVMGTSLDLTYNGGLGDDIISALDGNDTMNGRAGDDDLSGGSGNDTMNGGNGDDYLRGGSGNDTISGGAGDDDLDGGSDNDAIDGGASDDDLRGGSGDDSLKGGIGNDDLRGGSGNDLLTGDAGADHLRGGSGDDTYIVDAFDTVIEAASSGYDMVQSAVSHILENNFERLDLTGTASISGTGNTLANLLFGNSGNNTLDGGRGADVLNGNRGRDALIGGSESDRFVFAAGDSGQTFATMDSLRDFEKGAVGVGDCFDFSSALTIGGSADAATADEASINQVTGVASFSAGSGITMADALSDVAARFTVSGDAAGEFALFRVNANGSMVIFVSDGVAGVGPNDLLVQLFFFASIGSIDLSNGDLTILS